MDDEHYLLLALHEAENAYKEGNFPAGAVLVDQQGNVVGHSRNQSMTMGGYIDHAELILIQNNQAFLKRNPWSASLFITLEPCIMCLGAALLSRISRIVWAAEDYWAGGTRSYDFSSVYLALCRCELAQNANPAVRNRSLSLISSFLQQRNPEVLERILGGQQEHSNFGGNQYGKNREIY